MKLALAWIEENGLLMTDACNTAQKLQKLLREVIEDKAKKNGMTGDKINMYEADCWHHLRNV